MRKCFVLVLLCIGMLWLQTPLAGQIFEENFDYPAGDALTDHGWIEIRSGTPFTISSPGLTYPNYPLSGIGNAVSMVTGNEKEVKNVFPAQTSDSIYISFLMNISDATTRNDGVFFYLGPTDIDIYKREITVYVRKDTLDNLAFGISKGDGTGYTNFLYPMNMTHLLVIKYKFNPGVDDDELSLWVNPCTSAPETTPDRMDPTGTDVTELAEIVLSQLTASNTAPTALIDGIRITTSWFETLRGDPTCDGNVNVLDILAIANHIIGLAPLDEHLMDIADCNGDGKVNVLDMVGIANVIIGVFTECPG